MKKKYRQKPISALGNLNAFENKRKIKNRADIATMKSLRYQSLLIFVAFLGSNYVSADPNKILVTSYQIKHFEEMLLSFRKDTGSFPTTEEGLEALLSKPKNCINWQGPYLNKTILPLDSWGSKYVYKYEQNDRYILYSLGENKIDEKGQGDDVHSPPDEPATWKEWFTSKINYIYEYLAYLLKRH